MQYRVKWYRSGVKFTIEYRKTFAGAVSLARSKGWFTEDSKRSWPRPVFAYIEGKHEHGEWMLLAKQDKDGVHPVPHEKRPDIKRANRQIRELQMEIHEAKQLEATWSERVKVPSAI